MPNPQLSELCPTPDMPEHFPTPSGLDLPLPPTCSDPSLPPITQNMSNPRLSGLSPTPDMSEFFQPPGFLTLFRPSGHRILPYPRPLESQLPAPSLKPLLGFCTPTGSGVSGVILKNNLILLHNSSDIICNSSLAPPNIYKIFKNI